MDILALSLNHRVTPLPVRERVAFNQEEGEGFLTDLGSQDTIKEALLISTCNRTELYVVYEPDPTRPMDRFLLEALRNCRSFEPNERSRNYEVYRNEEAVKHLFEVAAGLDSQILGESQILGQVKSAMPWAQSAGTAGRSVQRLWERALRVGKRVRTETAIGDGAMSASYAALELARKVFGRLDEKNVLVVGTGEIGLLALDNLKGVPLANLTLANRTRSVAEEIAIQYGGKVRDLQELPDALVEADLVISSTGSREPLIRYDQMKKVRQRRGGDRPLLVVDLAIPRDFDEDCATLDNVFLKNLDDLTEIVQANIAERQSEIPRAQSIIEKEVTNFFRWRQALDVEPTIREVRKLFHAIRDEELKVLDAHLESEHFGQVDRFTQRLVNRLLHVLASNLRRHDGLKDQELMSVIHQLLTEEIPHPGEKPDDP